MDTNTIINIERAIINTILSYPEKIEEVINILKDYQFSLDFNNILYNTIIELYNNKDTIDDIFIQKKLLKQNLFDENSFLDILSTTPITNLKSYAKELIEYNKLKNIKSLALKILQKTNNQENNSNELLKLIETNLNNIYTYSSDIEKEMFLYDIVLEQTPPPIIYSTGIKFLDKLLGGGFEMGQLVTITGEQEAGKTQLVNQILFNIAQGFKTLYFSLEFNKRQIISYTQHKIKKNNLDINILKNIAIVTDEMTTSEIDDIILSIKLFHKKYNIKFVAIDSQMMLYEDDSNNKYATSEEKTTSIFRKLHNISKELDICILLIAQSSKEDGKTNRVEIFGSKKAAHLARIMIHIKYDKDEDIKNKQGIREIFVAKNKQTGKIDKFKVYFDKDKLQFVENINKRKKPKTTNNNKNSTTITIIDDKDTYTQEELEVINQRQQELQNQGIKFDD